MSNNNKATSDKIDVATECDHIPFSETFGLLSISIDIHREIIQEITEFCVQTCRKCKNMVKICSGIQCNETVIVKRCFAFGQCGGYITECESCKSLSKTCSICMNHILNQTCSKCINNEYAVLAQYYNKGIFVKCQTTHAKRGHWSYINNEYTQICNNNSSSMVCNDCSYLYRCRICDGASCSNCLRTCDQCKGFLCYDCSERNSSCAECKRDEPKYYWESLYHDPKNK